MKRGFPRPQVYVEATETYRTVDSKTGHTQWGSYGEKWDKKTYPIPYTAEETSISTLHWGRMEECARFHKCVACGESVTEEIVSVLYKDGQLISESGPFHEKCARLTQRMCPHIAVGGSAWEFKQVAWDSVKVDVLRLLS